MEDRIAANDRYADLNSAASKAPADWPAEEMYLPLMDVLQQIEPPMCRDRSDWI